MRENAAGQLLAGGKAGPRLTAGLSSYASGGGRAPRTHRPGCVGGLKKRWARDFGAVFYLSSHFGAVFYRYLNFRS